MIVREFLKRKLSLQGKRVEFYTGCRYNNIMHHYAEN